MKKALLILALSATFAAAAQQDQLPPVLSAASQQTAEKLDTDAQDKIAASAKKNTQNLQPATKPKKVISFHEIYTGEDQNIYTMSNNDPIITGIPAPGPNFNYFCFPWD